MSCPDEHERSVRRDGDKTYSYCLTCNRERNRVAYRRVQADPRFWALVRKQPMACWSWLGSFDRLGYGRFMANPAYRVAWEDFNGSVPEGMTLDHLCRNRGCVNPAHMELTTPGENTLRGEAQSSINARKTHCIHGHAFDADNTYLWRGKRNCRACNREAVARHKEKP